MFKSLAKEQSLYSIKNEQIATKKHQSGLGEIIGKNASLVSISG